MRNINRRSTGLTKHLKITIIGNDANEALSGYGSMLSAGIWEIFVTEQQWGNIQRLFGDSIVSYEEIKTPSPTTPEQLPKE